MDIGLMMDCDYREDQTPQQAFAAALLLADHAETLGFDTVWLAERHFSAPGGAALVSSVGSAPLLMATAIATRTSQIRIGTAVLLLPLGHPVRLAEEVATLDHLSQGRLDLGIGRSSFPRAYTGYNIPYEESRERFREYLEVMRLAWTQPRFSYAGRFYSCRDLEVIPKPYQQPHPPLHHAAATRHTFAAIGTMGLSLLVALIGTSISELAPVITEYQAAWQAAGHPGQGPVRLRLPVYVAETLKQAQEDPRLSVMPYYERLRQGYLGSTLNFENAERSVRATQLATLTYEEVLQERVVFGTPGYVTERLCTLQRLLNLSGFIIEANVGGGLSAALVARSLRLFMQEVAPQLRKETCKREQAR
jgi:alkanesulfonate monooxygenase SsuD/methylene tetrahydromethanopterin reductase-like flavin-dependent oxidoreductase (luciferase family)